MMKLPCFLLFVLVFCYLKSINAKREKNNSNKDKIKFPTSGQLVTKDNHTCAWEISGDEDVVFLVNCNLPDSKNYWCKYMGSPQQCPAYSTKAIHYWKEIIGRIKKKKNACENKTLKPRICKRGSAASHLRLVEKNQSLPKADEKERRKGSGRRKDSEKANSESSEPQHAASAFEQHGKSRKIISKQAAKEELTSAPTGEVNDEKVSDDNLDFNEGLSEEYCNEKWQSFCSLLVSFWNG
ncbi:fibroblast growth factor-binding protein 3 [Protopterus annectens]|uniref:fibroblast growth factor-binding protein 3 n=1 Tax=Protopterus annectens TaxID=7888 RepID=UPI001CFAF31E|nr:fibroblast growth factor-binding protein 3 [Protopterus annectens]